PPPLRPPPYRPRARSGDRAPVAPEDGTADRSADARHQPPCGTGLRGARAQTLSRPSLCFTKPSGAHSYGNGPSASLFSKSVPRGAAMTLDEKTRTELEAAAFRRLLEHLRERTDVQNIDLMNL